MINLTNIIEGLKNTPQHEYIWNILLTLMGGGSLYILFIDQDQS